MDPHDQKVLDDVANHGWHVTNVLDDEKGPGWAFSIGLYKSFQHPEIVFAGLNLNDRLVVVNDIGERIRGGEIFEPGKEYSDLLEVYNCTFCSVGKENYKEYLGSAIWYYEGTNFPVLQCVWPDFKHKFPWDEGFDETMRDSQPLLGGS